MKRPEISAFATLIKKKRNDKNLSLREAAKELQISHGYLDRLEKGTVADSNPHYKPAKEVLESISKFYDMEYDQLLDLWGYESSKTILLARHTNSIGQRDQAAINKLGDAASLFIKRKNEKPDFGAAVKAARTFSIEYKLSNFPLHLEELELPDIFVSSYLDFEQLTECSIQTFLPDGAIQDGFTIMQDGKAIVLYNQDIATPQRKNWTIAHELAHICLQHKVDNDKEEVEANFFAAELLAPMPIIDQLATNGASISVEFLEKTFYLSHMAAEKRYEQYKLHIENKHRSKNDDISLYDEILCEMAREFILSSSPNSVRQNREMEEFLDRLDEERAGW